MVKNNLKTMSKPLPSLPFSLANKVKSKKKKSWTLADLLNNSNRLEEVFSHLAQNYNKLICWYQWIICWQSGPSGRMKESYISCAPFVLMLTQTHLQTWEPSDKTLCLIQAAFLTHINSMCLTSSLPYWKEIRTIISSIIAKSWSNCETQGIIYRVQTKLCLNNHRKQNF